MKNKLSLLFLALFMGPASLRAGVSPGKYEVQDLGGNRLGEMTVSIGTAPYQDHIASKVVMILRLDSDDKNPAETDEAFVDSKGLGYFKRVIREEGQLTEITGEKDAVNFLVRKVVNGEKTGFTLPLKGLESSDYELDLPGGPFFKMVLGQRRALTVFSVNDLAAVPAVRIVTDKKEMTYEGRTIEVFISNTNIGGKVVHSMFEVKTHRLIFERQPNRILRRIGA